jgi:SAM-dependent methyltransferase
MTIAAAQPQAFDSLADYYDSLFTNSVIGRAQRNAVWSLAQRAFRRGDQILELGCGSGEDALFLVRAGMAVLACDISARMIAVASASARTELPEGLLEFCVLGNEDLRDLPLEDRFSGVFSNFSSLNCVADLRCVARDLAARTLPGASALLCFSSRICLWEMLWYLLRGQPGKAFRRIRSGSRAAKIGAQEIQVSYPSVRRICEAFAPWFELQERHAIGLLVPPSYVEPWASGHPTCISWLARLDGRLRSWPVLRDCGDHVLLHFRRISA